MARPSPITIGLTALLGAILCVAIWLLVRPRQLPPQPAATAAVPEWEERPRLAPPTPAPRAPGSRPLPLRPPVTAAAPAYPAVAATPARPPEHADAGSLPRIPFEVRRDVLVKTHNLRMSEADEEVFTAMNLPEATRVRIREINEEHRRRTERAFSSTEPPSTGAGVALTSNEARQVALNGLLGNDGARQFGEQERAAVRKIRGKFRYEWGQQSRQ